MQDKNCSIIQFDKHGVYFKKVYSAMVKKTVTDCNFCELRQVFFTFYASLSSSGIGMMKVHRVTARDGLVNICKECQQQGLAHGYGCISVSCCCYWPVVSTTPGAAGQTQVNE